MNEDLSSKKCVPCESGVLPLGENKIEELRRGLEPDWHLVVDNKLRRAFGFKSFRSAIDFVNRVAEVAEAEGHHPDMAIHYNRVILTLWTHAFDGLSENDFILAAKLDKLDRND